MIRLANYSANTYRGWFRVTTDSEIPAAGSIRGTRFVRGRPFGNGAHVLDVQLDIRSGQVLELPPIESQLLPAPTVDVPAMVRQIGTPTIAGVAVPLLSSQQDGAAALLHFRAKLHPTLVVNLWLWAYPGQGWCRGEVMFTAGNPETADLVATIPADLKIDLPGAVVTVPGRLPDVLMPAGETLADAQSRSWPLTVIWTGRLSLEAGDWASAAACALWQIAGNGIVNLWPGGYPVLPVGMPRLGWTREHWHGAIERLHNWEAGMLGAVAGVGQTGDQEDQVFVGGQCEGREGLGAEIVRYFVALGQSRQPCQHLEADGSPLSPANHPDLVLWSSRPHWHTGVSPDQLGKLRGLTTEAHGWGGPDREHWLLNTLAVAARLTGSTALQAQLHAHGRNFLLAETIDPRLSTSSADAARSAGWAGLVVVHLWRNLGDRALAQQVADRWRQRVLQVYVPQFGARLGDIWDPRADARIRWEIGLNWEQGWMPEQQAVGAYGLDLACELLNIPEGRALALRGAKAVLRRAFVPDSSGRWVEWERLGYRGEEVLQPHEIVEGSGGHRTGWYRAKWFPLATATVLRHEPQNERALSIWRQQVADGGGGGSWFPPEVVR